jgi:hypothetical protein
MSSPGKRISSVRAKDDAIDTIPEKQAATWTGSTKSDGEFLAQFEHHAGASNAVDIVGYGGLRGIEDSISYFVHKSDLLDVAEASTLYQAWSAKLVTSEGNDWLILPKNVAADGMTTPTFWADDSKVFYKSDKILVRKSYRDIAKIIMKESVQHPKEEGIDMLVSGSPGTGKSFFARFFLWQLLHPSAGVPQPEMVIWHCCRRGRITGWVYYKGQFFVHEHIDQFTRSQDGIRLINSTDCWMVYDGTAPKGGHTCKRLVISSPGSLFEHAKHVKEFRKDTQFWVFLPPWSLEELKVAAKHIYKIPGSEMPEIQKRWMKFGGIARYVLQAGRVAGQYRYLDPVSIALDGSEFFKAVSQIGTVNLDHNKASGVLIHLIPGTNYRDYSYEWGSTYIAENVFDKLFNVTKRKVEAFIAVGQGISTGSLFGLLFEPWFHRRIREHGYTGRFRKLCSASELAAAKTKKRGIVGMLKDPLGVSDYRIPQMDIHHFYHDSEIDTKMFNVLEKPNYPTIDSLAPHRGEMFQITSSETHRIKASALVDLKSKFTTWLQTNKTVKFIFVVPPSRFAHFTTQSYIEPVEKIRTATNIDNQNGDDHNEVETEVKGKAVKVKKSKSNMKAPEEKSKRNKTSKFDDSWLEQYVLEMDVTPLARAKCVGT